MSRQSPLFPSILHAHPVVTAPCFVGGVLGQCPVPTLLSAEPESGLPLQQDGMINPHVQPLC